MQIGGKNYHSQSSQCPEETEHTMDEMKHRYEDKQHTIWHFFLQYAVNIKFPAHFFENYFLF